jgi:DNA-binding NtrC family response regulator
MGDREILLADPTMLRLYELIRRLAGADLSVLIHGETGSGKEHAAFALHHESGRRRGPFVPVNCAALPENLVESELFGHEQGAFTGADRAKAGLLETADGGTIFLDEIGELSPSVQAKLLRALENGRVMRLGSSEERKVDVRVVAATNRDLEQACEDGSFREDLYFRIASAVVTLPALRERPREIPVLARRFLESARPDGALELSSEVLSVLARYPWPGNVRELKNAMEYLAATCLEEEVKSAHLPPRIASWAGSAPVMSSPEPTPATFRPIGEELEELERQRMMQALDAADGVQTQAAKLIGMPLRTFVFKLKRYGLRPER